MLKKIGLLTVVFIAGAVITIIIQKEKSKNEEEPEGETNILKILHLYRGQEKKVV